MKTQSPVRVLLPILLIAASILSGCATSNTAKKFEEFEKFGIVQAEITGKFSHTEYSVSTQDGKRRAVIVHSNIWIPTLKIVRETALPVVASAVPAVPAPVVPEPASK